MWDFGSSLAIPSTWEALVFAKFKYIDPHMSHLYVRRHASALPTPTLKLFLTMRSDPYYLLLED